MKIKSEQMKNHLITYKQHSVFIQPVRKSYNYNKTNKYFILHYKKENITSNDFSHYEV